MEITEELDESLTEAWRDPEKLPEKHEWLKNPRSEAARAQYAFLILKRHFAAARLPVKYADRVPWSWAGFGSDLWTNVDDLLGRDEQLHAISELFEELCYFCEIAFPGHFVYYLKEMLENIIKSNSSRTLDIYLPVFAADRLDEIKEIMHREWEDYCRRMDEMYY